MKGFLYVIGAIGTQSLLSCVLEAIVDVKFGIPRAAGPLSEDHHLQSSKTTRGQWRRMCFVKAVSSTDVVLVLLETIQLAQVFLSNMICHPNALIIMAPTHLPLASGMIRPQSSHGTLAIAIDAKTKD